MSLHNRVEESYHSMDAKVAGSIMVPSPGRRTASERLGSHLSIRKPGCFSFALLLMGWERLQFNGSSRVVRLICQG